MVSGTELKQLLAEGHSMIPTQWIEIDKAEHKRREGGGYVPPEFKSRLVACGNFEDTPNIRTDSPTCDLEGVNLVIAWAASFGIKLTTADIRNAYFQGKPLDRPVLLKTPRSGLPDVATNDNTAMIARVPIYGLKDSGRGFWKELREVIISTGMKANRYIKALYTYQEKDDIKVMLATHVDDLMYACKAGYEHIVQKILDRFEVRETQTGNIRFCGREIIQDEQGNIRITCRDTTEKILPINSRREIDLQKTKLLRERFLNYVP